MNEAWKIFFSTINVHYHFKMPINEMNEIILRKHLRKGKLFSPLQYSVKFDNLAKQFTIIRRGYFLPMIATGFINEELKTIDIQFKPLLNPIFVVVPVLIFMFHQITNGTLFFTATLFLIILAILFVYVPISKEKKQLVEELQLNRYNYTINRVNN